MTKLIFFLWLAITCLFLTRRAASQAYGDAAFWQRIGDHFLTKAIRDSETRYEGKAKNVILFIGDGMDIPTQTLAGHMKTTPYGTHRRQRGMAWEGFPHMGLSRTYSVNSIITDSGASASAMTHGVKAQNLVTGLEGTVTQGDCFAANRVGPLESIFKTAKKDGRAVAVITTDALTAGTPQTAFANTCFRGWSYLKRISEKCKGFANDTAIQLIKKAVDYEVMLGGGYGFFYTTAQRPAGYREDQNVADLWRRSQRSRRRKHRFVTNKRELNNVDTQSIDYLFGLFAEQKMTSHPGNAVQPSLRQMVEKAFHIVKRNKKGFFMMVEGANVDKYNHENRAHKAAIETDGLDEAVTFIKENTDPSETLIVVTSDHGHTTTFGNNMLRNQNPFDLVKDSRGNYKRALDRLHYPAISYGSGPASTRSSSHLLARRVARTNYQYNSLIHRSSGAHGGAYVPVYGLGVDSHFLSSTLEQPFIYYVIEYASCLRNYKNRPGC